MELLHIPGAWPLYTNTFLLFSGDGRAAVVDPAADAAVYEKALAEHGARLTDILLTHGHYDHVASAAAAAPQHRGQSPPGPRRRPRDRALPAHARPHRRTLGPAADGTVEAAGLSFRLWHTPGHTKGGVCLYTDGCLFCGDTLFAGSCGRMELPGGSVAEMQKSLAFIAALAAAGRDKGPARARALFHPWRGAPPKPLPDGGSLVKMFCVKL